MLLLVRGNGLAMITKHVIQIEFTKTYLIILNLYYFTLISDIASEISKIFKV